MNLLRRFTDWASEKAADLEEHLEPLRSHPLWPKRKMWAGFGTTALTYLAVQVIGLDPGTTIEGTSISAWISIAAGAFAGYMTRDRDGVVVRYVDDGVATAETDQAAAIAHEHGKDT